jgi:hypothetical protein
MSIVASLDFPKNFPLQRYYLELPNIHVLTFPCPHNYLKHVQLE